MDTYTVLMDLNESYYYFQTTGSDLFDSLKSWSISIDHKRIKGLGPKSIELIKDLISYLDPDDEPVLISGAKNVWFCFLLPAYSKFGICLNIVKVDSKNNLNEFYSIVFYYQGGTYICQVYGKDINQVVKNYLEVVERKDIHEIKWLGAKTFQELKGKLIGINKPKKIDNFTNCWLSKIQLNYRNSIAEICIIKTAIE